MGTHSLYKVVQIVRNTFFVIEECIELERLSEHYRTTLCGCDPLGRIDGDDECIVEYLFYEVHDDGSLEECPDPRNYVDSVDYPSVVHACAAHQQHLIERSGQIDEYEEESILI